MPSINLSIHSLGPLIPVKIGISMPRQLAMKAAGIPIPPPVTGNFLIDTGASGTCVDPQLIQSLNLPVIGSVSVQTPSTQGTPHSCSQYDSMIFIPDNHGQAFIIPAMPIMGTHLQSQGIDGLLGRDIIDRCTLIYNGSAGIVTLAY